MTIQLEFDSNGTTITAEVDERGEGELVILDGALEQDDMLTFMTGQRSPLWLLNYLWNDPEVAAEPLQVCLHRDDFSVGSGRDRQWYRINDPDVRLVLSFMLPIHDRVIIASTGEGYSIEHRLIMLEGMSRTNVALFLAQYTGKDLLPQKRHELEDSLDEESTWLVVEHGNYQVYTPSERFRLVMRVDDAKKVYALGYFDRYTHDQAMKIISSITDEDELTRALCYGIGPSLTAEETMQHASRLTDPRCVRWVVRDALTLNDRLRRMLLDRAKTLEEAE